MCTRILLLLIIYELLLIITYLLEEALLILFLLRCQPHWLLSPLISFLISFSFCSPVVSLVVPLDFLLFPSLFTHSSQFFCLPHLFISWCFSHFPPLPSLTSFSYLISVHCFSHFSHRDDDDDEFLEYDDDVTLACNFEIYLIIV